MAAVVLTRWPFRSEALFDFDSANFALAIDRIDIARHQPHPPGYLGYVLAARAINLVVNDHNASLVLWNIVASAIAVLAIVHFAWHSVDEPKRRLVTAAAAAGLLITSPLFWFYGEIAEIYVSEPTVVLLVALGAFRVLRGTPRAIYGCVVALACAVLFKITAALLLGPLAAYAWMHVPYADRRRSIIWLASLGVVLGAGFLVIQPDLPQLVVQQFMVSTAPSRLAGGEVAWLKSLNRNLRDVVIAGTAALGVVGVVGTAAWCVASRRLPDHVSGRFVLLWAGPWLVLLIGVHIGRPGYILPIVPLGILILAAWYGRLRRSVGIPLLSLHIIANVGQFVWLPSLPRAAIGGMERYGDKTPFERLLSDARPITTLTASAIAQSDARIAALRREVGARCPDGDPIFVDGMSLVDWRRALWYFPAATAIVGDERTHEFIARRTGTRAIAGEPITLSTRCAVIWLEGDGGVKPPSTPSSARAVINLGWETGRGEVTAGPHGVSVTQGP
jgi:hypothetical protein